MLTKYTLGFFFTLLSLLTSIELNGQRITWGEEPRNYSKNTYFTPIGESPEGIFILSHNSSTQSITRFSIERLTHNLLFQNKKSVFLKQQLLKRISILGNHLFLATAPIKTLKGENKLIGALLDKDLEDYQRETHLLNIQTESKFQEAYFSVKISPNQQFVGALGFVVAPNKKSTVLYYSFHDQLLQKIAEVKLNLDYELTEADLDAIGIDNKGGFYFVNSHIHPEKKTGEGRYNATLTYYHLAQKQLIELQITDPAYTVREVDMTYDDSLDLMIVSGFYGEENSRNQEGVFQYAIQAENAQIRHHFFSPFPKELVSSTLGEKLFGQGYLLTDFYIKKLIRTHDGNTVLIAERYFSDTYVDQFWSNGQPVSVSKKQFNYDEIIVLSMDSIGKFNWHKVIQKKQSSDTDYGYYSSILIQVLPTKVVLLYNDRMGSGRDVLFHSFDKNGEMESGILLNGTDLYTYIVPMEGKQIGYNRTVVPIARNREYSLIKITF